MVITINPAFSGRRISHHNCCKTIADHTPSELMQLAIEARKSNNTVLLECFDELPSLNDLLANKTAVEIATAKNALPPLTPKWAQDNNPPAVTMNPNPEFKND